MLKFLSVCFLVGLVKGQSPHACCCVDNSWEAIEGFNVGSNRGGKGSLTEGGAAVSFDTDLEKINSNIYVKTGDKVSQFRLLQDYKQKWQYMIDAQKKCKKTRLTDPFQKFCIPAKSKKVAGVYFGSATASGTLDVDSYRIPTIKGYNGYVAVTAKGCIPFGELLMTGDETGGEMINISFMNYTQGIRDMHVFDVPPECNNASLVDVFYEPVLRLRRSILMGN